MAYCNVVGKSFFGALLRWTRGVASLEVPAGLSFKHVSQTHGLSITVNPFERKFHPGSEMTGLPCTLSLFSFTEGTLEGVPRAFHHVSKQSDTHVSREDCGGHELEVTISVGKI